jgi:predicted nucleic acid-binding protein
MKEAIFLDSNIFMYAAGKPHLYQELCIQIVKGVELKNIPAVINTEILQELLYRYSHIGMKEKGVQLCRIILSFPLIILPVTESDLRVAVNLYPEFVTTQLLAVSYWLLAW